MSNALPLLFLLLACPLMMIFMMKGMHGGGGHDASADHQHSPAEPDGRDRRIADLEQQVADLRAQEADRREADDPQRGR